MVYFYILRAARESFSQTVFAALPGMSAAFSAVNVQTCKFLNCKRRILSWTVHPLEHRSHCCVGSETAPMESPPVSGPNHFVAQQAREGVLPPPPSEAP